MSSVEESLEKRQLIEKDARQIAEETRDLQLLEEELREQLYVMRSKKEQKQQRIHNQAEITRRHSAVLEDLRKQCRELDAQRNMLKNTIAQNEQASARSRAVRALREQQDSELHERHSAEMRQLRLLTTQADERARQCLHEIEREQTLLGREQACARQKVDDEEASLRSRLRRQHEDALQPLRQDIASVQEQLQTLNRSGPSDTHTRSSEAPDKVC